MSEGLLGSTNRSRGSHPGTEKASLEIGLRESRDLAKKSELAVVQGFKNVGHVEFVLHVFVSYEVRPSIFDTPLQTSYRVTSRRCELRDLPPMSITMALRKGKVAPLTKPPTNNISRILSRIQEWLVQKADCRYSLRNTTFPPTP